MFRWLDTLSGRLTIFVIIALVLAQIIGVLTFVRSNEHDESEKTGEGFVRSVAGVVVLFNSPASVDRRAFIGTIREPGFIVWTGRKPAVEQPGTRVEADGQEIPANWGIIRSPDKRLEYFSDARPLLKRYSIAPLMVIRNMPRREPGGATGDLLRGDPPGGPRPDGPPRGGPPPERPGLRDPALTGRPIGRPPEGGPPPGALDPPEDQVLRTYRPAPEDDYGPATTVLPPPPNAHVPPVRWRMSVQLNDGQWVNGEYLYTRGLPAWMQTVLYQNGVIFALMLLLTVPGIGYATYRLSQLADAADKLGRGEETEPLAESGTRDIRRVTQAFNQMSLRLRRFVQGRTQMLAGISHDLRTPITGLRLRAELVDDEQNRDRMLALIDDMHHLTEGTLRLARDDSFTEKSDVIDISAFIGGICDDLTDAGIDATADVKPGVSLMCRRHSLRRAIRNLAENGAKYGHRSRISLEEDAETVRIVIDDDGPGIPDDQIERAFQPFVRLEESRSRETGGSGLGLAITRSIVLNHGGEIALANRPEGGLRATISLPRSKVA